MRRLAGVALAAALLLGACGGSAVSPAPTGPTGSGATSAGTTPAPVTTAVPSGTAASQSPGSSSGPNTYVGTPPPPSHADAALEAKLPDSIRAVRLTKSSYSGSSMPATETEDTKPTFDLLARLGKKPADLAWATAADPRRGISTEEANALPVFLVAYQVKGVSGADLLTPFLAIAAEQYASIGFEKGTASIGGQTIQTFVLRSVPQAWTSYLVPRGDILYIIQTPDEKMAAEALGSLQ
jgi:hypothetical protein